METEREESAERQVQLHLKGKLLAPPVRRSRVLRLILMRPAMSGYGGPAWTPFCFIDVHLGGRRVCLSELPVRYREVAPWKRSVDLPMGWDWPYLSLDIEVERSDYCPDENLVFRKGPHTSNHVAVFGTARVPLIDALVLGDDSDDEEEDHRKRRRDGEQEEDDGQPKLVEGTRVFDKAVPLQGWQFPEPEEENKAPANVVMEDVDEEPAMDVDEAPADVMHGGEVVDEEPANVVGGVAPKGKKKEEPANVVRGVLHVCMRLVEH